MDELYGKFEVEFYLASYDDDDGDGEFTLVKTVKKTDYKTNVEFYAQEQIDMGNYDDYIVYYVGKADK